ncbi:olfactory receptor 49-like [Eublepharis macularius]|uniref:Olfactory receptor n=1 Tax=Eublepharis macularius TaxID=481883 RepID=A0AA97K8F6_EUBMA|nr:olfactory receptor 49-like [Eublepharis macularius]
MKYNETTVNEFILQGFTDIRILQLLFFSLLFFSYLLTIIGNAAIITIAHIDHRLRTPMYFFLWNFSLLEIGFTTAIVPQTLTQLATGNKKISYIGCMLQSFLYFQLGTSEFFLLAVMSFDRYVAICNPLHYPTIMNNRICTSLVLCSWLGSFLLIIGPSMLFLQYPICGSNVLNHFFCDNTPLIKILCGDTRLLQFLGFISAVFSVLGSLSITIVSYVNIVKTVIRIPSATGRQKAFSTCASHFIVVSITYGSCIFLYIKPNQNSKLELGKVVAVLNTMVSPLLNPFIYCLRNKQVQEAWRDALVKFIAISKGTGKL